MTIRVRLINGLGYLILVALLVLSCGLGAYAAYIAMIAALIGFVVAFDIKTLAYLLRHTWLQMWLLAFVLIATAFVVSAQSAQDMLYAFDFVQMPLALAAGLIFSKMSSSNGMRTMALLSFLGSAVALAVALYGTNVLRMARPSGIEMSTIHFAYFAIILGFLSLADFFVEGQQGRKIFLFGPVMGLIAAALTGSRGSILVLSVLLLVLLIFFLRCVQLSHLKKAAALICVPIIAVGVGALVFAMGHSRSFTGLIGVFDALGGDYAADASAAYRVEHFSGGFGAFLNSPWFGHGWVNQMNSALPYMSTFAQEAFAVENWAYLHNEALSLAVSAGVLGLMAYVLIFAAPLAALIKSKRDSQFIARAYGLLVVTGGLAAGGLTEVLFKYEVPKTFLFFMVPILLIYCRDDPAEVS